MFLKIFCSYLVEINDIGRKLSCKKDIIMKNMTNCSPDDYTQDEHFKVIQLESITPFGTKWIILKNYTKTVIHRYHKELYQLNPNEFHKSVICFNPPVSNILQTSQHIPHVDVAMGMNAQRKIKIAKIDFKLSHIFLFSNSKI